jgi:hypothetical protein
MVAPWDPKKTGHGTVAGRVPQKNKPIPKKRQRKIDMKLFH